MNVLYKNDMLSLSKDDWNKFKGKLVFIIFENKSQKEITIKNFICAQNPPYLYCGFITDNDENISWGSVSYIEFI